MRFTTSLCVVRILKIGKIKCFLYSLCFLRQEYLMQGTARAMSVTVHASLLTGNTF